MNWLKKNWLLVAVIVVGVGHAVSTHIRNRSDDSAEETQQDPEIVAMRAELEALRQRAAKRVDKEIDFLKSSPGTETEEIVRAETPEESSVTQRVRTEHGSYRVTHGGVEPDIVFRESGPMGYLFPAYRANHRRIELGFLVDENSYPPPIAVPQSYRRTHVWHLVKHPHLAGEYSQAVVDRPGQVWALAERPDLPEKE